MERDVTGPGFGKVRDDAVDRFDHQVYIDWLFNAVVPQRFTEQWADRQVGYEMIVHDVEVHDVGTGIKDGTNVLSKSSEIGGQYRRGDQWCHSSILG
jgi:hypothetical protein